MPILDSYQVGDKLTEEDFANAYYMPAGAYQYVEIAEIDGDQVQLIYVDTMGSTTDSMWVSKAQMARMLGWEEDPLIGADDAELAEYGLEVIMDEDAADIENEEIIDMVQNAPTEEESGEFELLDVDDEKIGCFIKKRGERILSAYIFGSKEKARAEYKAMTWK